MSKLINVTEEEIIGCKHDENGTLILLLNIPVFRGEDVTPRHFAKRWIGFFETKRGNHYIANPDKNDFAYIVAAEVVERANKVCA